MIEEKIASFLAEADKNLTYRNILYALSKQGLINLNSLDYSVYTNDSLKKIIAKTTLELEQEGKIKKVSGIGEASYKDGYEAAISSSFDNAVKNLLFVLNISFDLIKKEYLQRYLEKKKEQSLDLKARPAL